MTTTNNTTKAQFNAERTAAGYKYLDSLRELMGVGQPVGEGPERDETAMEKFRRSVGFQFGFVMYSGLDVPTAIDHICASAEVLLAARAAQPATALGDAAAHAETQQFFDDLLSETPAFRTTKEAMEYAARHEIPSVIPVATPTDIAERARRAFRALDDAG
jgi:hypothetical protein